MAYADGIRTTTATMNGVADLIEGIAVSTFPLTWGSWSPSYAASGAMTWTGVSTTYAKYFQIGKVVFFSIRATGTIGGTPGVALTFTLPVTAVNTNCAACHGVCQDNGIAKSAGGNLSATTIMQVIHDAGGNWTAGTGLIQVSGFYEAA